jgi:hypothetical protein
MPQVLCTCHSICSKEWSVVNGTQVPGCFVSYSTRRRHEKEDADEDKHIKAGSSKKDSGTTSSFGSGIHLPSGKVTDSFNCDLNLECFQIIDVIIPSGIISTLCCTLVVWLHVKGGISQTTANTVLKSLQLILSTIFTALSTGINSVVAVNLQFENLHIPCDVRTALHQTQGIDPTIIRTISCPVCYKQFTAAAPFPIHCDWKETPHSQACKTSLWRLQRFGKTMKWVPKSLYNTQDFESWLSFFVGRKSIEDYLESAFRHKSAAFGADMHDLQDSPAWKDMKDFLQSKYSLVFGLYIDWFNPHTNKIAGMYSITVF